MSGHSKWHSIKHKKAAVDAKRGKIFTKIIKEITVAARLGGGDVDANPRLRLAVDQAKDANMPKENIERAIKKGTGELEGVNYEELSYEGYGDGGVAVLVEIMTDNKNRTVAEIRNIFSKNNGNLGENGCVSWLFEKKGIILIEKSSINEEDLYEKVIEAEAEDFSADDDEFYEIITDPKDLIKVREALEKENIKIEKAEITKIPKNKVKVTGKTAKNVIKLLELLDENDDVSNVYSNADIEDTNE